MTRVRAPFHVEEIPYYRRKRRVFALYMRSLMGNRYRTFRDNYVGTRVPR